MTFTLCKRSLGAGILLGAALLGAAWVGTVLVDRTAMSMAMLAASTCNDKGIVTMHYPNGGEFTCIPAVVAPPMTPERAAKGGRRN